MVLKVAAENDAIFFRDVRLLNFRQSVRVNARARMIYSEAVFLGSYEQGIEPREPFLFQAFV
jgi:hypothetical protein